MCRYGRGECLYRDVWRPCMIGFVGIDNEDTEVATRAATPEQRRGVHPLAAFGLLLLGFLLAVVIVIAVLLSEAELPH